MRVTIYSIPDCVFCKKAVDFFSELNISFTEHDITRDKKRAAEMMEKTGRFGIPVIKIGDRIFVGFNREEILTALFPDNAFHPHPEKRVRK